MTGQVKEDIVSRFYELGFVVNNGKITFDPTILRKSEFIKEEKSFKYVNLDYEINYLDLNAKSHVEHLFSFHSLPQYILICFLRYFSSLNSLPQELHRWLLPHIEVTCFSSRNFEQTEAEFFHNSNRNSAHTRSFHHRIFEILARIFEITYHLNFFFLLLVIALTKWKEVQIRALSPIKGSLLVKVVLYLE